MVKNQVLDSFKDKEVLITGGCGFLGSNLAHQLVDANAKVTIFDNLDPDLFNNDVYNNIANVEEIKHKINLIKGDIRDFESVSNVIKNKEIIFHCAAHTSHPESMRNPLLNLDINCKGSLNLLEAARRFNDKARIVHIGTSTQIGKSVYEPIDENHPEFPRDIYSANKMAVEKYHLIYNQVHGLPTVVLRAANTYGPRAAIHSPNFGFINYFIGLALKNKDLTVYSPGDQRRTVNYIEDTADAILKGALAKDVLGETLFITSERNYTIKEIAESISRIIGGKLNYIPWPKERKSMEVGDVLISNKKSKALLNWTPKIELEEGLKRTKEYYLSRLSKYLK